MISNHLLNYNFELYLLIIAQLCFCENISLSFFFKKKKMTILFNTFIYCIVKKTLAPKNPENATKQTLIIQIVFTVPVIIKYNNRRYNIIFLRTRFMKDYV